MFQLILRMLCLCARHLFALMPARRLPELVDAQAPAKNLSPRRAAAGALSGSLIVKRFSLCTGRSHHQFLPLKQRGRLQAAVLPVTPPLLDDEEKRKQMSEDYGFKQIGEQLPDNITLKDVMDTLPKEVFEIDDVKAWASVLISVTSYAFGLFLISKAPWYLLPVAWAWAGTAVTGFFVIGHDCAHKSFSRNKLVEDIVGTLAFLPLIYPYEPWRFKHDRHHAKTNMLVEDTAWQPVWQKEIESSSFLRKAIIVGYGPIRPWMSIAHWTRQSLRCCGGRSAGEQHTEVQPAMLQLVVAEKGRIEILCHDINVHVPHHISPRIPSYNLRAAHNSIKQNWGKYINEASWNWRLMKTILTTCHVYDKERYYVSFDELVPEESQPIRFLKKFMPDYA
ncbi:unnamed protein product [Triticum turgidum subsp. durum]|uniref:Fatty acid desaturase domain-containing protein n=1 Tax=Triticum turgidum subsp. durum TaxID=4567 RepID=A0A9R1NPA8_TRITD|nr:unnamed protein product [Triticum turgidum subsp. durum]